MNLKQDGRLERGEARRAQLLDAAVTVIAERGTGSLTHRAVATEAGVSLASATYHFPGIVDLRQAAFDHAGSRIGLAFRALVEANQDAPERLPEFTGEYAMALVGRSRQDTVAVFSMILASSYDEGLRPVIRKLNSHLADLLRGYVGDHAEALTLSSSIQGIILTHLATGAHSSTDDHALREAVTALVRRFAAPPI